jgi:hypothetical protein
MEPNSPLEAQTSSTTFDNSSSGFHVEAQGCWNNKEAVMWRKLNAVCQIEHLEFRRLLSTIYVDAIAPGPTHNGSSWTNAYTDLQQALAIATSSSTIDVAQGTYKPTTGTTRTVTYSITNSVALYGGYAGYGTPNPNARSSASYQTILSGDIGTAGNNSDNSYHVVDINAFGYMPILDGFTITGGNANAAQFPNDRGGGLDVASANAVINNCNFTQNNATEGAGVYILGQSVELTNCTFSGNSASDGAGAYIEAETQNAPSFENCSFTNNLAHEGGGVYNASSLSTFTNCIFSGNEVNFTTAGGGGMYNYMASPILTGCTFESNSAMHTSSAAFAGGGLEDVYSSPTLINCSFIRNTADAGGGMLDSQSTSTLNDCTFEGNTCDLFSGGALDLSDSPDILNNCLFVGNTASTSGGAIEVSGSKPAITNCTFAANVATTSGNAIEDDSSSIATLKNCILWNAGSAAAQIKNDSTSSLVATFSDLYGFGGTGDIASDPLFIRSPNSGGDGLWGTGDDDYGDLHLQFTSACVDSGSNAAVRTGITTDLDGNTRIFDFPGAHDPGAIVDMGAYELGYNLDEVIVSFGGTLALPAGAYTFTANYLSVGYGQTLDIGNDTLIVPYTSGTDPVSLYASYLTAGYSGGNWNSWGIVSSSAAANTSSTVGVGYYDNGSQVIIRCTWIGDANLDGQINADDLSLMLLGQAQGGTRWQDGNFNYDTQVNADDWIKFMYVNAYSNGQIIPATAPAFAQTQIAAANDLTDLLDPSSSLT